MFDDSDLLLKLDHIKDGKLFINIELIFTLHCVIFLRCFKNIGFATRTIAEGTSENLGEKELLLIVN